MTRQRKLISCCAGLLFIACRERAPHPAAPVGAVDVSNPAPANTSTPSLASARDGTLWMSWTERRADSSYAIRVAARRNGQWDSTRTISEARPFFVNWADFPTVSLLNDGALAAHWLERNGDSKYAYGIRVTRSSDGGRTWTPSVAPHTDGLAAEHGFVSLWADGTDGLGLAWLDGRKSAMKDSAREMTVRSAVVGANGTLTHEAVLDARSCDCCQVSSAGTTTGRVVVYRDRSPAEIRDIVAVRSTPNGWSAPVPVHVDDWHYAGCPVNGPAIVSRGDTLVVAWYTAAHDSARVLAARSTDGGATFGAPVRIDDGEPVGRVAVAFAPNGSAAVVWMEHETPETASVRVRTITSTSDAMWQTSASRSISTTSSARQSGFPRVAVLGDSLFVAWTATSPSLQVHLSVLALPTSSAK